GVVGDDLDALAGLPLVVRRIEGCFDFSLPTGGDDLVELGHRAASARFCVHAEVAATGVLQHEDVGDIHAARHLAGVVLELGRSEKKYGRSPSHMSSSSRRRPSSSTTVSSGRRASPWASAWPRMFRRTSAPTRGRRNAGAGMLPTTCRVVAFTFASDQRSAIPYQ